MKKYINEYSTKLVKLRSVKGLNGYINSSEDAVNVIKHFYDHDDKEKLYIIMLNGRKKVIGVNLVAIGTVDSVIMHPREIFKTAILASASAIILIHNHPSEEVVPSTADIELTDQIIKGGKILDIQVLDHIIYSEDCFYSIYDGEKNSNA